MRGLLKILIEKKKEKTGPKNLILFLLCFSDNPIYSISKTNKNKFFVRINTKKSVIENLLLPNYPLIY